MELQLGGHLTVVTGGSSGIGYACACAMAREGSKIALWDVSANVAEQAGCIRDEYNVSTIGIRVDVANFNSVLAAVEETQTSQGPIGHLIHSAAIPSGKFGFPFTNITPSEWPRVLEVNILGMVHVAQAIAPEMISRRFGTMVFIASVAGQIGSQTDPPYSATKAANINFAQCLAKDLAPHKVRVNTVCPGMVQTTLNRQVWQAWFDQQPEDQRRSYEDWAGNKIRSIIPLGSWQRAEDVADMVTFLSSERASQVTGQTINVDGGFVMHW